MTERVWGVRHEAEPEPIYPLLQNKARDTVADCRQRGLDCVLVVSDDDGATWRRTKS